MKSLRLVLLATASSVVLIGNAVAADMPVKARAVEPVMSWAGPYVGINAGVAWNRSTFSNPDAFSTIAVDPIWSDRSASFLVGVQVGYNFQSGRLVYGVEADIDWVNGKSSAATLGGTQSSSKFDWMSTIRARGGVVVAPQILVYSTGGVAFAHFSDSWGFPAIPAGTFDSNSTRTGWVAGGGVEYMVNRNWTVRVEALYADFGSTTQTSTTFGGPYRSTFKHSVSVARAALNWKW